MTADGSHVPKHNVAHATISDISHTHTYERAHKQSHRLQYKKKLVPWGTDGRLPLS